MQLLNLNHHSVLSFTDQCAHYQRRLLLSDLNSFHICKRRQCEALPVAQLIVFRHAAAI